MNKNGNTNTTGLVSLILFVAAIVLLGLTIALTYIPRDNDFASLLSWMGMLIGLSFFFLGLPMLFASFVTSIVSIMKVHQQRIGYMVLASNMLLLVGVLLWLFRQGIN